MELSQLVSPGLWAITSAAGAANVKVKDRVTVARICNAAMVSSVTADYGWQYFQHGDRAHLAGLIIFSTVAARAGLIAARDFDDKTRGRIVAGSFALSTALSIGSQIALTHGFAPVTLLPIAGGIAGCIHDYSKNLAVRRRCILANGLLSLPYAALTCSGGLAAKNLFIDIGWNGFCIKKYKDPLPSWRAGMAGAKSLVRKMLRL